MDCNGMDDGSYIPSKHGSNWMKWMKVDESRYIGGVKPNP